jgi:antitoxin component of MazEF toxin-antitoxin module
MNELFRLKIGSKRQMTAPQRLLDVLHLNEGDEIQIEIAEGQIVDVHPCKAVPTRLLNGELLSKIEQREERMMQGHSLTGEEALRGAQALKALKSKSGLLSKAVASRKVEAEKKLARQS